MFYKCFYVIYVFVWLYKCMFHAWKSCASMYTYTYFTVYVWFFAFYDLCTHTFINILHAYIKIIHKSTNIKIIHYICMFVSLSACMYVCMYIHKCEYASMHVYMRECMHLGLILYSCMSYDFMHVCMNVCRCVLCMYLYICLSILYLFVCDFLFKYI